MIRFELGLDYIVPEIALQLAFSRLSSHFVVLPPPDPPDAVLVASTVISTSTPSSSLCSLAPTNHTSALSPIPLTCSPRLFRISATVRLSLWVACLDSGGKSSMLCPASFGWMRGLRSVAFVSHFATLHCEPFGPESPTLVLALGLVVSDGLMVGLLAFCHARACQYAPHRL